MFQDNLEALLQGQADPVNAGWQLRELSEKAQSHSVDLLDNLLDYRNLFANADPAIVGTILRILHASLLSEGWGRVEELESQKIFDLEEAIPPQSSNRFLLQQLYAMIQDDSSLELLVSSLSCKPPSKWVEAAQVLSPLMQKNDWNIAFFFSRSLVLLQQPSLASPLLDLANYVYREQRVPRHPMFDQVEMLRTLLGEVVGRLGMFEEDPRTFGNDIPVVQARLAEAVALAVSLCDAVALIGDLSSIGKLHQAMELRHRRVQCEAAGALCRLGDDQGRSRLLALLEEPAARLRAVQYAEELGFRDEIEGRFLTAEAYSEADLALWLSQPQQMGVPPTKVEVLHTTCCYWPSFNEPVNVSLVRFEYNFGERSYRNVGVTGPVTFAMSADVTELSLSDQYAIYAGWHVEHDEIFTITPDAWNGFQRDQINQWNKHLQRCGLEDVKGILIGRFLDETAAIFEAKREAACYLVITDGLESIECVSDGSERGMSPQDLFNLYKGRKMLRTFNPDRDLVSESDE